MNKLLFVALAVGSVFCSFAETNASTNVKTSPYRKGTLANPIGRKVSREEWLKHTGGRCEGDTKGKKFLYLDATKSGCDLANVMEQMRRGCGIAIRSERVVLNGGEPFAFAREYMKNHSDVGGVMLFYDGSQEAPIESEYPMDKIAVINVTPLQSEIATTYKNRITAVTCRSMMFVAGGVYPFGVMGPMRPVFSASDLDLLKSVYAHPSAAQLVTVNAPAYGFSLHKQGTYRNACIGGWAPLPTNDYQKAIWSEVHAMPDRPLKIMFDPTMSK